MDQTQFENSAIIEDLAAVGLVDEFFDAVEADDIEAILELMRAARINTEAVRWVIDKFEELS